MQRDAGLRLLPALKGHRTLKTQVPSVIRFCGLHWALGADILGRREMGVAQRPREK